MANEKENSVNKQRKEKKRKKKQIIEQKKNIKVLQ